MTQKNKLLLQGSLLALFLTACGVENNPPSTTVSSEKGNLGLVANGEDFVRQGFVSKDGWQIDFNHVYVTLNQVTAHQTNPPFNPEEAEELQADKSVVLVDTATTIDLAQGDENASLIEVVEVDATAGNYNALAWSVVKNPQDDSSIVLDGTASKDNRTISFRLKFPTELNYLCGEFVGDERKGILEPEQVATLETTFHFDHLFGDQGTPTDDELNVGALGFAPLAMMAEDNDSLETDLATLEKNLLPEDYEKLTKNLKSLGHVGEGHCRLIVDEE